MVAYLAEKVEKCLLNGVVKYCLRTIRTADAVRNTEYRGGHETGFLKYYSEW